MRCEDVMKRPVEFCRDYERVQAAVRKMADAHIGFIPICDQDDRLVGTLTDRDIAIWLAADDGSASDTRIGDVMTHEIVSCGPSDAIGHAEALMAQHHESRIIVASHGRLVGVISLADLAAINGPRVSQKVRVVATREVLDRRGLKPPAPVFGVE